MYGNTDQAFEYFPAPAVAITCHATEAITGKRFVKIVPGGSDQAPHIAVCGAGERPYGVAAWTVAAGAKVTVHRAGIVSVSAGAALEAGNAITTGANGQAVAVAAATDKDYGVLHADAAINADAAVALSL